MPRVGQTMTLVFGVACWIFLSGGSTVVAQGTVSPGWTPQQIEPLIIIPVVEEPVVITAGESTLVGGHYGGQQEGCGTGTQAYIKKLAVDGSELWQLCHHSSPAGLCEQTAGQPFFAGFTSIDPAYIVASRVTAAVTDETTGEIATAGEVLVACDGPEPAVKTGGFVAVWDAGGTLLADTYIGDLPTCAPPQESICCQELCGDLSSAGPLDCDTGGCGSLGIAISSNKVIVTGWCQELGSPRGREVMINSYTRNLAPNWSFVAGTPERDIGLDVAIDPQGGVIATGFSTSPTDRRNIFVSRHDDVDGHLETVFLAGGTLDDEGQSVEVNAEGDVHLGGYFNEQVSFGELVLGGAGQGYQGFDAILDGTTLQPTFAQAIPMFLPGSSRSAGGGTDLGWSNKSIPGQPAPDPPPQGQLPPEGNQPPLRIVDCTVNIGWPGSDDCELLLKSDGTTLNILESPDPEDPDHFMIEVTVKFEAAAVPLVLKSFNLKLAADSCYLATVSLEGPLSEGYIEIGQSQVCPAEEPLLSAAISLEESELLGFTAGAAPPRGELKAKIRLDFGTYSCPNFGTQAEEASLDEIDMEVDV